MSTNKQKVVNALTHLCLAGPHRGGELGAALAAVAASTAPSFLILLAAPESLTFRGLYAYDAHGVAAGGVPTLKIYGLGPANLTPALLAAVAAEAGEVGGGGEAALLASPGAGGGGGGGAGGGGGSNGDASASASPYIVDACFKYATAGRCFTPISTRTVTLTTDAVTIRQRFSPGVRAAQQAAAAAAAAAAAGEE